ncbi:hypothetical protein GYMLUDRAFT_247144 [Collybiopsis luxurians FD-317 M1]|uniref:Uncharacterized protein n=1 Tax=Collybiopsis luxurians FD-317 M1 TaxID=944289 RepID=A0A0D0BQ15_9AGAR|nr:hypothetical protein GYMLUDRAFT_247144 [Collybiopsis luxurians FD-317 M1]
MSPSSSSPSSSYPKVILPANERSAPVELTSGKVTPEAWNSLIKNFLHSLDFKGIAPEDQVRKVLGSFEDRTVRNRISTNRDKLGGRGLLRVTPLHHVNEGLIELVVNGLDEDMTKRYDKVKRANITNTSHLIFSLLHHTRSHIPLPEPSTTSVIHLLSLYIYSPRTQTGTAAAPSLPPPHPPPRLNHRISLSASAFSLASLASPSTTLVTIPIYVW